MEEKESEKAKGLAEKAWELARSSELPAVQFFAGFLLWKIAQTTGKDLGRWTRILKRLLPMVDSASEEVREFMRWLEEKKRMEAA